jgi:hypothetical protein
MTPDPQQMKHFIRHTLGCGCPDEFLESIECTRSDVTPAHDIRLLRIDVGGRLLVYVIEGGDNPQTAAEALPAVLAAGMVERATGGFNRLRVVVACADPESSGPPLEHSFNASAPRDDKVHLHVIAEGELPFS